MLTKMTDKELENKLAKIGYSKFWLDCGVLTISSLSEQEELIDLSEDKNPEHYRYKTLRQFINSKKQLTDEEFENYLKLTLNDPDEILGGSATVDLFNDVDLTDIQFQRLCESVGQFGKWTINIIRRHNLLRKLKSSKLTNELFTECMNSGDNVLHEYLIDIADINQLQDLIKGGLNRRLRNLASEKFIKQSRK